MRARISILLWGITFFLGSFSYSKAVELIAPDNVLPGSFLECKAKGLPAAGEVYFLLLAPAEKIFTQSPWLRVVDEEAGYKFLLPSDIPYGEWKIILYYRNESSPEEQKLTEKPFKVSRLAIQYQFEPDIWETSQRGPLKLTLFNSGEVGISKVYFHIPPTWQITPKKSDRGEINQIGREIIINYTRPLSPGEYDFVNFTANSPPQAEDSNFLVEVETEGITTSALPAPGWRGDISVRLLDATLEAEPLNWDTDCSGDLNLSLTNEGMVDITALQLDFPSWWGIYQVISKLGIVVVEGNKITINYTALTPTNTDIITISLISPEKNGEYYIDAWIKGANGGKKKLKASPQLSVRELNVQIHLNPKSVHSLEISDFSIPCHNISSSQGDGCSEIDIEFPLDFKVISAVSEMGNVVVNENKLTINYTSPLLPLQKDELKVKLQAGETLGDLPVNVSVKGSLGFATKQLSALYISVLPTIVKLSLSSNDISFDFVPTPELEEAMLEGKELFFSSNKELVCQVLANVPWNISLKATGEFVDSATGKTFSEQYLSWKLPSSEEWNTLSQNPVPFYAELQEPTAPERDYPNQSREIIMELYLNLPLKEVTPGTYTTKLLFTIITF